MRLSATLKRCCCNISWCSESLPWPQVESSGDTISGAMKASIFKYCKALSTIWGRGYFYLYVGVTGMLSVKGAL